MPRSFTMGRLVACSAVLITALLCSSVALAQAPGQPCDYKGCLAKGEVSPEECSILACTSRPYLNREQCVCLRSCAMGFPKCMKAEIDAGSTKDAAQISCDVAKDACAKQCVAKKR